MCSTMVPTNCSLPSLLLQWQVCECARVLPLPLAEQRSSSITAVEKDGQLWKLILSHPIETTAGEGWRWSCHSSVLITQEVFTHAQLPAPAGRSMVLVAGLHDAFDGYRKVKSPATPTSFAIAGLAAVPAPLAVPPGAKVR